MVFLILLLPLVMSICFMASKSQSFVMSELSSDNQTSQLPRELFIVRMPGKVNF